MTADERRRDRASGGRREDPAPEVEYEGPGAWGAWAIGLLLALLLIATGATVHSMLVTLGG